MTDEGLFHQALPALAVEPLHFPDSHGRFLPANPLQGDAILSLRRGLNNHFLKVPDVIVGGSMLLYYDPRDPGKWIEPHIIVVLDHDLGDREPYKLWVEGKSPDFALDVIAPESGFSDQEDKKELYAILGIKEYFLFQPDAKRENPRLVGYRLWGQEYIELEHDPTAGPDGALRSATLGLSLRPEGERVRLRNLATDEDYAWSSENYVLSIASERKVAAAEERASRATQERRAADARAAAAEDRARRAARQRREADERARRAARQRREADKRARRAAQERREADERVAAAEERAAALEARTARLEALLATVGG